MIGSFFPSSIQAMYKIPILKYKFDQNFVKGFLHEECMEVKETISDIIENWTREPNKHK